MKTKFLGTLAVLLMFAGTANAQVKWHPGHYMMIGAGASKSEVLKNINEVGNVKPIAGIAVRVYWRDLEKSKGVYNFALIDEYLARLKAQPTPKRLVIRVEDRKFSNNKNGILPDYMLTSTYNGGLVKTKTGYAARLWEKPVMDRMIALFRAIGARYDGNPHFEGIMMTESTLGLDSNNFPKGYSHAALAAQYQRLGLEAKSAMPRSNLILNTNWIGSDSLMQNIMQTLMKAPAGAGGTNLAPNTYSQAQKVFAGKTGSDYRGKLPLSSVVETRDLQLASPKAINDFAYNQLRLNHIFWMRNTWSGGAADWHSKVLPFLKTNPPIRTNCPTAYGSCVK